MDVPLCGMQGDVRAQAHDDDADDEGSHGMVHGWSGDTLWCGLCVGMGGCCRVLYSNQLTGSLPAWLALLFRPKLLRFFGGILSGITQPKIRRKCGDMAGDGACGDLWR